MSRLNRVFGISGQSSLALLAKLSRTEFPRNDKAGDPIRGGNSLLIATRVFSKSFAVTPLTIKS